MNRAKWDFLNGKYEETIGETSKLEAKAAFGPIAATTECEVDAELTAKWTGKITANTEFAGKNSPFKDMSLTLKAKP